MRTESDSLGQLNIPKTAYYGIHTQRALHNFPISSQSTHPELIRAFLEIKQAAAKTNATSGNLDRSVAKHIVSATKTLLNNPIDLSMFPISDIQGGAGTSANMNVNEVIANVALEQTGRARGDYTYINPNDDVNMAQSTNDTYPSAGKIALLRLLDPLLLELQNLIDALGNKADEFSTTYKMGRTQLQDAVPMTLGNSFHAWLKPLLRDDLRIKTARDALYILNLGGSAIGSGINVSYHYQVH
ncbi:MAG: lyase family protein, partial [Leuconostoc gelidum]